MKYTIEGFNQEYAISLQKKIIEKDKEKIIKLDCIDLIILRWIVDFEPNMSKKIIDGKTYFWINYQSLLEALPILDIKKRMLCYRLDKMCDLNILEHKNVKEKGNYSYYAFDRNYKNLVQKNANGMQNIAEPSAKSCLTLMQNIAEQNNSSIKEINLLNNSIEKYKKEFLDLIGNFKINEIINAREAQVKLKQFLEQNYSKVILEEKVDSNGIKDYSGRIDITGDYYGIKFAIEFDNVNPREKSIYKVSHYDCDLKFVLLRKGNKKYKIGDIYVIGVESFSTLDSDDKEDIDEYNFNLIWEDYPRQEGKTKAFGYFRKWIRGRKINGKTIKLTDEQMLKAVRVYAKEKKYTDKKFVQLGSTFFNTTILDYIETE